MPGWLTAKQLKLGLDLKGGVHLVLRVQTDDALQITTTTTSEQLREELKTANVPGRRDHRHLADLFRVEGVPADRDAEFRRIADEQAGANYDRTRAPAAPTTSR